MSVQTLERATAAAVTPIAAPAICIREECRKPMLYRYQQTPGDGTATRSSKDYCSTCYCLAKNLIPFQSGRPPFQRRGKAHLEEIPDLMDRGLNANQIADDLGYIHRGNLYKFLRRHGELDLLRRIQATIPKNTSAHY